MPSAECADGGRQCKRLLRRCLFASSGIGTLGKVSTAIGDGARAVDDPRMSSRRGGANSGARATLNRRRRRLLGVAASLLGIWQGAIAAPDDAVGLKVALQGFAIDATEVTIGQFRQFVRTRELETQAERNGGGFEYAMGWERRPDWTWASPYGHAGGDFEPAVHVTWHEAKLYCESVGGRLPRFEEWRRAAYEEMRHAPTDGFERGRRYTYPVGDTPAGMNTSGDDQWPRHAPAGATRRGVNGLYDMGANVWEWMADRRGEEALTAGGSWWYGAHMTEESGAQYKPAGFAAVYIGFRCAYDADPG